ncbi:MAG: glycogen(starch) synthase [Parasphingorhabdus sp.]
MKILFWCESYWPYIGGVERFAMRLLAQLSSLGHEVMVVTSHGSLCLPDSDEYQNVKVQRFDFQQALQMRDVKQIFAIRKRLSGLKHEFKPDVVHINFQDPSVFFHLNTHDSWPAPTLLTIHGEYKNCQAGPETLLGRLFKNVEAINCVSQALIQDTLDLAPHTNNRISLIYNAIPEAEIERTEINSGSQRLLCVGRMVEDKGFDIAIKAFALTLKDYPHTKLTFASDGPERSKLQRLTNTLGLSHAVDFLGWVDQRHLNLLYQGAITVIMPSRWREGFGLVALEAAMHGRPVIASNQGGLPEVVVDGETGLLVSTENPIELAQAINQLLLSPGLATRLGNRAWKLAQSRFSFAEHIDQYVKTYEAISSSYLRFVRHNDF